MKKDWEKRAKSAPKERMLPQRGGTNELFIKQSGRLFLN